MNQTYGIFKKLSADNHFVSLTKALNSARTTKETQTTLKNLTVECSHGGYLVIHNGICYASFIHNYTERNDDPFSKGLVLELGIFPLERALAEDFDKDKDMEVIRFDKNEELCGHINSTCAFISNSLNVIGDNLYITLGCQVDGGRYPLYTIVYDTKEKIFHPATEAKLLYKDSVYPMDDESFNMIYKEHGLKNAGNGHLCATSKWSEYKGYYYSAFLVDGGINNNGLLIKTKDFETYEFVSVVPENERGGAEIGTCIYENKLYAACRQRWTTPYMLFSRYNLDTNEWSEPYAIEDGISRPWMFVYENELYLYNTLDEGWRRYANISKVRTDKKAHNEKNSPIDTVATIYGCGAYHSFFVYENRIFFVCSYMGTVHFGELKLKQYSPEKVNDKLLALLGDDI